jgi:poly(U)-specific endoribonuclease
MIERRLSVSPSDLRRPLQDCSSLGRRSFLRHLGAAAALALWPSLPAVCAAARDSIYQRIWDVDQSGSGIPAIAMDAVGDPVHGFVRVDQRGGRDPKHRLFAEVQIPADKRRTYDLCQALFDNYRLDQSKPEDNQPAEAREILALLEAVADAPPMAAARAHLEASNGSSYSSDEWQERIFELWFRQFDDGRNLDLSGFEHVMVGEQKGGEVNGHHFWYILRKSAQNG